MKKKIFAILIVAVVAVFAGYNVYQSQKGGMMSDLMLANVEALANNTENGGEVSCTASTPCGSGGSVSCSGVSGCASYIGYVKCCDSKGVAYYSYCGS